MHTGLGQLSPVGKQRTNHWWDCGHRDLQEQIVGKLLAEARGWLMHMQIGR